MLIDLVNPTGRQNFEFKKSKMDVGRYLKNLGLQLIKTRFSATIQSVATTFERVMRGPTLNPINA